MSVVAFYTNSKEQTGNTIAAISLATYLGIERNRKTLFISTDLNDYTVRQAFWATQTKRRSGLFGPNTNAMSDNGIEGLDRVIRSNKISPDIITDYSKVVLKGRLEILLGYKGEEEQYKEIQKQYLQIVNLASRVYDMVIIDIDRELEEKTQLELLNVADVVIGMTTQKLKDINELAETLQKGEKIKKANTLLTIGRYDNNSKYNAKNISRNVLRQKQIINTIPYNTVLFDSIQEGLIIDFFIRIMDLKGRDENSFISFSF